MHPWEDWAETWAHHLHMVDTHACPVRRRHDHIALGADRILECFRWLNFSSERFWPLTDRAWVDTLSTARGYDLAIKPRPVEGPAKQSIRARALDFDNFDDLLHVWSPLTLALNSLKLRFVHEVIEHAGASEGVLAATLRRFAGPPGPAKPRRRGVSSRSVL